jgi:hypothetical protein
MPISADRIQPYLEDYARVTGSSVTKFVCPITHHQCEPEELIEAHILNEKLRKASRRKVLQYGKPDHFYGSRVEPGLVQYLNQKYKSDTDFFSRRSKVKVILPDGSEFEAFPLRGEAAISRAARRFPIVSPSPSGSSIAFAVKTDKDDPRFKDSSAGQLEILITDEYMPIHWAAGMLKAAYLTMFEMIGYRMVFEPFGDSLRRNLAQYYYDYASSEDALLYFGQFRNATKVMGRGLRPPGPGETYQRLEFDTLEDRKLLLHFTPGKTLFAATCIFQVNDTALSATIPQSTAGSDLAVAVEFYDRLMLGEPGLPQIVQLAQLSKDHWKVSGQPLPLHYPSAGN